MCAPDAAHRIFGFAMSDRSDAVIRLQIHLPGFETMQFDAGAEAEALEAAENRMSTLIVFFAQNMRCSELETEFGSLVPCQVTVSILDNFVRFYAHDHTASFSP